MVIEGMSQELEKLKADIMKMGLLVKEQIYNATKSLVDKNAQLAHQVIHQDQIIDQMELEIEKKALGLIALRQPMAGDLRLIASALRMIVDMERMGDHAEDIARITLDLHGQTYIKPLIDIPIMAKTVQEMVEISLQAFIAGEVELAMTLIPLEIEVHALYDLIFKELLAYMMKEMENLPQAMVLLLVAGHLERIGDHATNLAEVVAYIVKGQRIDLNELSRAEGKGV